MIDVRCEACEVVNPYRTVLYSNRLTQDQYPMLDTVESRANGVFFILLTGDRPFCRSAPRLEAQQFDRQNDRPLRPLSRD